MNTLTLGIDLGVNSIGTALVDTTNSQVVFTGARIFPAAVHDVNMSKEDTNAASRRQARLQRRQTERRKRRLRHVALLLQRYGLLPAGPVRETIPALDRVLHEKYRETELLPYHLRALALEGPLEPHELGRALYHLAQRRGFLSNRRAPAKKDEKPGEVATEIKSLEADLAGRTLGEYFSGLNPHHKRIRTRRTSRAMYEHEFQRIWDSQTGHHPEILTMARREELYRALFHQRPLKDQTHLVGACELVPSQKRAAWASMEAQRFRVLQAANNLRWQKDGILHALSPEQREVLCREAEHTRTLTYAQARKVLGFPKGIQFTVETEGEKQFPTNKIAAMIFSVLGDRWKEMPAADRDALAADLCGDRDDRALRDHLRGRWACTEADADLLSGEALPEGYARFSLRALRKLIPLLEQGLDVETARRQVYPPVPTDPLPLLPPVETALPEIRNHKVVRALTELRKTVNAIIRRYGKPAFIHVELARDLKKPRDERQRLTAENAKQRKRREASAADLARLGFPANRRTVDKHLLWLECHKICPYSGRTIAAHSVFGDNPHYEIEHIIPFSRSFDDSFDNKTLAHNTINQIKGNRTPWQAFGEAEDWEAMCRRVESFGNKKKLRKFVTKEVDDAALFDEEKGRLLNDTRYAARLAARYAGLLYGGVVDAGGIRRVRSCAGGVTALLRRKWDLDRILNDQPVKSRDDHRHHAVDAVVIALATPAKVKAIADAAGSAEQRYQRKWPFPEPWVGFREQVAGKIAQTNVSYRPKKSVAGKLHEETLYGRPRGGDKGRPTTHVRVPVTKLTTEKHIGRIVDPVVRDRVLEKFNALGKKAAFENNWPTLETRKGKTIEIRKVRIRQAESVTAIGSGERQRWVKTGGNHHMEIVEEKTAKGKTVWRGTVVSSLEAAQRTGETADARQVVRRNHDGGVFQFSLTENDTVELGAAAGLTAGFWLVRGMSDRSDGSQRIQLSRINDARPKTEKGKQILKSGRDFLEITAEKLRTLGGRKVFINHLGEVLPARD